jgi:hypothetical protein
MLRTLPTKRNTAEEAESKNLLTGSSGERSTSSLPETEPEQKIKPLTDKQKKIVERFYPKARATAAKLKESLRSYRQLSIDEEELIDDLTIDYLQLVTRRLKSDLVGAFFEVSFNNYLTWGQSKFKTTRMNTQKTISLYDEDNNLLFDVPDSHTTETIDSLLEELDIPYKNKVRRLLQGESIRSVFPTEKLRKHWQRYQLPRLQQLLQQIYKEQVV